MRSTAKNPLTERKITITRVFDAPRDIVFNAWIDPKQLVRWWGPRGFTNPVCEIDPRPGGVIRIVMRAPDGTDHPMRGRFREVVPPERLVFEGFPVDKNGEPMMNGVTIVRFTENAGKTTMILEAHAVALVPEANPMLDGMQEGWSQTIDRLVAVLAER